MKLLNLKIIKCIRKSIFTGCLVLISHTSLAKQPPFETGQALGSQIASFNVVNQYGEPQYLNNIMKEKGAIIVLFRSADWCPFCKRHLLELNASVENIKQKGYGVTAISNDPPKILRSFSQKKKLNYSLLSDQNVETFKALNVVNKENEPGDRNYGIPYPGVIVVNQNGKIVHKYFYEGYKERVMFKQLVKDLL